MVVKYLNSLLGAMSIRGNSDDEKDDEIKDKRHDFRCVKCKKSFRSFNYSSRHKSFYCKNNVKTSKIELKMYWDGKSWIIKERSKIILYQIRVGFELDKLIGKKTVAETDLNLVQKEFILMYRRLCSDAL